jgi:hypothetical protein
MMTKTHKAPRQETRGDRKAIKGDLHKADRKVEARVVVHKAAKEITQSVDTKDLATRAELDRKAATRAVRTREVEIEDRKAVKVVEIKAEVLRRAVKIKEEAVHKVEVKAADQDNYLSRFQQSKIIISF